MHKHITFQSIYDALEELNIPHTREGLKIKGLRYITYVYLTTGQKLTNIHTDKYSKTLPESFHQFFTQVAQIYIK